MLKSAGSIRREWSWDLGSDLRIVDDLMLHVWDMQIDNMLFIKQKAFFAAVHY